MSDEHVDWATGNDTTGDGTAASPWKTIGKAVSLIGAGDTIWVIYTHDEVFDGAGGNLTWTFPATTSNPAKMISVETLAGKVYRPGAKVTMNNSATADWTVANARVFYGFTFDNDCDDFLWTPGVNEPAIYIDCTFSFVGTAQGKAFGSNLHRVIFINCTFECPSGNAAPAISANDVEYYNCTFTGSGWSNAPLYATTHNNVFFVKAIGCNFAGLSASNTLFSWSKSSDQMHRAELLGCQFNEFLTMPLQVSPDAAQEIQFDSTRSYIAHSAAGTIGAPTDTFSVATQFMDMTHSTSVYRTGGASQDGTNLYTWKFTIPSGTNLKPYGYWILFDRPICTYVSAGSKTLTLKWCSESNLTLDKSNFWFDIYSPSEIAAPNATARFRHQTTRDLITQTTDLDGTPATYTPGSSGEWTGSGPANYYQTAITIAPTYAGPVYIFIRIAAQYNAGDRSIWLDPTIAIS